MALGLGKKYTTFVTDDNSHKFQMHWRHILQFTSIFCLDNLKRSLRILAEANAEIAELLRSCKKM
jgi:hypothetical protein